MTQYYVIASQDQGDHKLVYETGRHTWDGAIYMGDILEAKLFESLEEVCDYIKSQGSKFMLGCSIISIADVTLEILKTNKELYKKFHDPLYAVR